LVAEVDKRDTARRPGKDEKGLPRPPKRQVFSQVVSENGSAASAGHLPFGKQVAPQKQMVEIALHLPPAMVVAPLATNLADALRRAGGKLEAAVVHASSISAPVIFGSPPHHPRPAPDARHQGSRGPLSCQADLG
jgi:hypothetical protein